MDRFIDYESLSLELAGLILKSNMDRFIVAHNTAKSGYN